MTATVQVWLGALIAFAMGSLFLIYGVLFLFRPDLAVKFHDLLNRGPIQRYWTDKWRKDVYKPEYRMLGAMLTVASLFIFWVFFALILGYLKPIDQTR